MVKPPSKNNYEEHKTLSTAKVETLTAKNATAKLSENDSEERLKLQNNELN